MTHGRGSKRRRLKPRVLLRERRKKKQDKRSLVAPHQGIVHLPKFLTAPTVLLRRTTSLSARVFGRSVGISGYDKRPSSGPN